MPPSTPPSSTTAGLAHRRGVREAHAKASLHGEHENVQRFRTLMHGRQATNDSAPNGPGEDESVDVDTGGRDSATAAADANELPSDQEQALRDLLQRQLDEGRAQSPVPAARDQHDEGDSDAQDQHRDGDQAAASVGLQAVHLAQQVVNADAGQALASHAATAPALALAELIERHVKQLLVPEASGRSAAHTREIMITLKDGLLPGTELWLSRTDSGWKLRADTRSSTAYRSLVEGAPQLIERFARSKLGALEISPSLIT